jgi:uncharacterized protein
MERVLSDDKNVVLRFDPGEEIVSGLLSFAESGGVDAASVSGIGSAREVELGFYDLPTKEYLKKVFSEPMEVISISGDVGILGTNPAIHLHGSFGTRDYQVIGGHVHRLVVNTTLELMLDIIGGELKRAHDDNTGLNLLQP